MGLGTDVHILVSHDWCKSHYGSYFLSYLEKKWLWNHKKVVGRSCLWGSQRSFGHVFIAHRRSR